MVQRQIKGSNLPSININKQSLLLLNRLDGDEIKTVLNAIQQYVYKGEEIEVDEGLQIILESVLDNIEHIGVSYLNKVKANRENGKKGGRPKKNNQDIPSNTEFDSEVENKPNKTVITAEYPNPQPKIENPSEGQEMGKNEVLEIKSSVPDVEDIDNDFRYAQTDPYENPELSFLLDDDEFEKFEEEWKNNEIIHKIICKVMDVNVNAEYVDDIVMILKQAIKDGIVDWSVIRDGVNSISLKHKRSKMEVDGLIKMVMSDMQAA